MYIAKVRVCACRWDAGSGASRVELHGGATTALLQLLPDGTHQRAEVTIRTTYYK